MKLAQQLREKDLLVLLGAGGVGKTTVSAACALEAAKHRRTLVLTIDPAKRLADAMGITLGSEVTEVRPGLDALMLDTKKALDDLVEKYAPSPETLQRIMRSQFYAQLSDAFAGSEEFVAMGTLYELLHDEGDWEVIIVDTPPSKHAVDFLDVNRRLIRVFDSGVVKWVFKPTRILRLGGGYVARALARWTSTEYLEEVADFVVTFDDMFLDMEDRVRTMQGILTDQSRTGINLVTSAEEESVPVSLGLRDEVVENLGLHVDAAVVNRVLPMLRGLTPRTDTDAARKALEAHGVSREAASAFVDDAELALTFYATQAQDHARNMGEIREALDADDLLTVPALGESVHDMEALERVRAELFGD